KLYPVAAGGKIAAETLAGAAGDTISLGGVRLAGDGERRPEAGKVTGSAAVIAQAKGEKVGACKKRRRHNYRRKAGHRQQMTLLRIVQVGDSKAEAPKKAAAAKTTEAPQADAAVPVEAKEAKAPKAAPKKDAAAAKPAAEKKAPAKKASKEADAPKADQE